MPRSPVLMLLVFALTLFCSATLLFLVEPMIGKMILPLLGGTPAVWNTCMVFFQAILLLGYGYAHVSTSWLGPRKQAVLHLLMIAVPFLFFPLGVNRNLIEGDDNPIPRLLLLLSLSVGVPMFVVSASAPLLQKWFASTSHPAAHDPYFLYGASNLGSMLALIAYPTLVEPNLRLAQQGLDWSIGYGILAALTVLCAVLLWRSPPPATHHPPPTALTGDVTWPRVLRWVALAFVPSSLMLGATTYITTDIAAIPLLWVIPLALYLLSFILVFSRLPAWVHKSMFLLMLPLVLLLLFLTMSELARLLSIGWSVGLHLATLFVVSMVCHGELARDRPDTKYLTGYYLWMSVGGVLGGLFNGLFAPLAFNAIVEYPLALVLACLLLPPRREVEGEPSSRGSGVLLATLGGAAGVLLILLRLRDRDLPLHLVAAGPWRWQIAALGLGLGIGLIGLLRGRSRPLDHWFDFLAPLCLGVLVVGLIWGLLSNTLFRLVEALASRAHLHPYEFRMGISVAVPLLICCTFLRRPLRFSLGMGAVLLAGGFCGFLEYNVLYQQRSFFGVHRVVDWPETFGRQRYRERLLYHGTTVHGKQFLEPPLDGEPLAYFHRSGPVGQVMSVYNRDGRRNLAVIGLGAGSLACYAQPGQHLTFYEIDPVVRRLAFDDDRPYFTYVRDAVRRGAHLELVMGDARLTMERKQLQDSERYGLLIVDAFSSDSLPVHLITREAMQVYLDKLTEDGLLVMQASNRHLDLRPVLANLAAERGLSGLIQRENTLQYPGKLPSRWVVMARKAEYLDGLRALNDWEKRRQSLLTDLTLSMGWPDNGTGLAGHALLLRSLFDQEICRRRHRWEELKPGVGEPSPDLEKVGVWTDDYSNLLRVLTW